MPLFHEGPLCLPRRAGDEFVESIAAWRKRARAIRAFLNLKASLKRGELGAPSEWKILWPGKPPVDKNHAASFLAIATNLLLSEVGVQPALLPVDNLLTISFLSGNFFELVKAMCANENIGSWLGTPGILIAEIAVGAALALQEGVGWRHCSNPECRRLYRPKRHTPEGRLNFCPLCGKRASWRLAKQRRAAERRKAAAKRAA